MKNVNISATGIASEHIHLSAPVNTLPDQRKVTTCICLTSQDQRLGRITYLNIMKDQVSPLDVPEKALHSGHALPSPEELGEK